MDSIVRHVDTRNAEGEIVAQFVPINNAVLRMIWDKSINRLEEPYFTIFSKLLEKNDVSMRPFNFNFVDFTMPMEKVQERRQLSQDDKCGYAEFSVNLYRILDRAGALREHFSTYASLSTSLASVFKMSCIPILCNSDVLSPEVRSVWNQFVVHTKKHLLKDNDEYETFILNSLKYIIISGICTILNRRQDQFSKDGDVLPVASPVPLAFAVMHLALGMTNTSEDIFMLLCKSREEILKLLERVPLYVWFPSNVTSTQRYEGNHLMDFTGTGPNGYQAYAFLTTPERFLSEDCKLNRRDIISKVIPLNPPHIIVQTFIVSAPKKDYIPKFTEGKILLEHTTNEGEFSIFMSSFMRCIRGLLHAVNLNAAIETRQVMWTYFFSEECAFLMPQVRKITNIFGAWQDEILPYIDRKSKMTDSDNSLTQQPTGDMNNNRPNNTNPAYDWNDAMKAEHDLETGKLNVLMNELTLNVKMPITVHFLDTIVRVAEKFSDKGEIHYYNAFGYLKQNIITLIGDRTASTLPSNLHQ